MDGDSYQSRANYIEKYVDLRIDTYASRRIAVPHETSNGFARSAEGAGRNAHLSTSTRLEHKLNLGRQLVKRPAAYSALLIVRFQYIRDVLRNLANVVVGS
jgi:hypothetical protein